MRCVGDTKAVLSTYARGLRDAGEIEVTSSTHPTDMAVVHRWWLLPLADARAAFSALATMDDLLSPDVTRRMSAIRRDASRARLLITARLDPTDSEEWQGILDPPTDDYGLERSAAARLVGLLAAVASEAGELHSSPAVSSPPSLIEAHLVAAGWTRGSIETTLRGRPIAELFAQLAPQLRAVTAKCQPWLVGGWLDRETAAVSRRSSIARLPSWSVSAGVSLASSPVVLRLAVGDRPEPPHRGGGSAHDAPTTGLGTRPLDH